MSENIKWITSAILLIFEISQMSSVDYLFGMFTDDIGLGKCLLTVH